MDRKLGKLPVRHDARTLKLRAYLTPELAPPPAAVDWYSKAQRLGMLLNDQLGDCGPAMAGHQEQCWTAANGVEFVPTNDDVLSFYELFGYVPGDPSTDNGVVLLDLMNKWRSQGFAGHKIDAYAALDLKNREHFKQAIYLGGSVSLGFDLPLSFQDQADWRLLLGGGAGDPTPGSWGGHAVPGVGYTEDGLWVLTWGAPLFVSWDAVDAYCDEAYMPVSADWADADGAPSGVNLVELRFDAGQVAA